MNDERTYEASILDVAAPAFAFTIATVAEVGKVATKIIRPDETKQYDLAKWWKLEPKTAATLDDMALLLRKLALKPSSMILRGAPVAGLDLTKKHRRLVHSQPNEPATIAAVDRDWLALDIDGADVPAPLGNGDQIAEAARYVRDHLLSQEFIGVRMIAAASASTGRKGPTIARLRLFARIDRPVADERLRRWAKGLAAAQNLPVDHAIFAAAQPIYTARPRFLGGAIDPVPSDRRVAILDGDDEIVALNVGRFDAVVERLDQRRAEATRASGGDWRRLMEETVGINVDGDIGDFAGTYYDSLSAALGLAARSDDGEEQICDFVAQLLAERADRERQAHYGPAWVSATLRSFKGRDESREADPPDMGPDPTPPESSDAYGAPGDAEFLQSKATPNGRPKRKPFALERFADIKFDPSTEWRVKNLIPRQGVGSLFGKSATFKSFVAIDTGHHISLGWPWGGHRVVEACPVVYIAAEGPGGVTKRVEGCKRRHPDSIAENPPFYVIKAAPNLGSESGDIDVLIESIEGISVRPGFIVIDTARAAMGGQDENNLGMAMLLDNALKLSLHFNAFVLLVMHVGHGQDASKRERGHSSVEGNLDVRILAERLLGEERATKLTVLKEKDDEDGETFEVALRKIEICRDRDDDPVTTLVVDEIKPTGTTTPKGKASPKPGRHEPLLFACIEQAIDEAGVEIKPWADGPLIRAAPEKAVQRRYYARKAEEREPGEEDKKFQDRRRKAFKRAIDGAIDGKRVNAFLRNDERLVWLP